MKHFVMDEEEKPLHIIVFSNIEPTHPWNYLLHVALGLGEFSNELDILEIVLARNIFRQPSCTR
jgi:hypothetical protein